MCGMIVWRRAPSWFLYLITAVVALLGVLPFSVLLASEQHPQRAERVALIERLESLRKSASALEVQGRFDLARIDYAEALALARQSFPANHWRVHDCESAVEFVNRERNFRGADAEEAKELRQIDRQISAHLANEQYRDAIPLIEEILPRTEKLFDGVSLIYLSRFRTLTLCHMALDSEDIEHFKTAVKINQEVFGFHHPQTLKSIAMLNGALFDSANFKSAFQEQERLLRQAKDWHRREQYDRTVGGYVVRCCLEYAESRRLLGLVSAAEDAIRFAKHTLHLSYPPDRTKQMLESLIANEETRIALVKGDHADCEAKCLQALAYTQQAYGSQHRSCVASLCLLAKAFAMSGKVEDARRYLEQAEEINNIHSFGLKKRMTAYCATVLSAEERLDDARDAFEEALSRATRLYGPEHPRLLPILKALQEIYKKQRYTSECQTTYRRIAKIQEEIDRLVADLPRTFRELQTTATAGSEPEEKVRLSSASSPQLAFERYKAGVREGDWHAHVSVLTPESRAQLLPAFLGAVCIKAFLRPGDQSAKNLLIDHNVDLELARTVAIGTLISSDETVSEGRVASEKIAMSVIVEPFLVACLEFLEESDSTAIEGSTISNARLVDVRIDGEHASGWMIADLNGRTSREPIAFRRINGSWYVHRM